MDIRVEIDFSPKANELLNRLIEAFGPAANPGEKTLRKQTNDVETAEPDKPIEPKVETSEPTQSYEEATLRVDIKNLSIDKARAGKSAAIKELTSKFGYEKQSDLPTEVLVEYMSKLKEL